MSRTFKTSMFVCLTKHSHLGPEDLASLDSAYGLSFVNSDYSKEPDSGGYFTPVGTAQVEVTLIGQDELITNKVKSLEAEMQKNRADAFLKETELKAQIQQLLAITHKVPA